MRLLLKAADKKAVAEAAAKKAAEEAAGGNAAPPSSFISDFQSVDRNTEACIQQAQQSINCCENPIGCMGGGEGGKSSFKIESLMDAGQSLFGQGQSGVCGQFSQLGGGLAALSTAKAGLCERKKNKCHEACEGITRRIQNLIGQCANNESVDKAYPSQCGQLTKMKSKVNGRINRCHDLDEIIMASTLEARDNLESAKMAKICKARVASQSTARALVAPKFTPIVNTDCNNPVNATNPMCRFNCQGPGAANNPYCQAFLSKVNNEAARQRIQFNKPESKDGGAGPDVGLGLFDNEEGGGFFPLNIQPKGTSVVGGGGSGPGGGSRGSSLRGGGSNSARQGSRAGQTKSGYDTNILKGARSRMGYSGNYKTSSKNNGGFRGYGKKRGIAKKRFPSNKFDLKKFLPGGRKAPKRGLASTLGVTRRSIASQHTDIWEKISNRYRSYCQSGVLKDCQDRK